MAQISKGWQYQPSGEYSQVTHENLNAHVDNATLTNGAIVEQDLVTFANNDDLLLLSQNGSLVSVTKESFLRNTAISTGEFGFGGGWYENGSYVVIHHLGFTSTYLGSNGPVNIFNAPSAAGNPSSGFGDSTTVAYSLAVSGQGFDANTIGLHKSALIVDFDSKLLVHGRNRTKDFTPSGTIVAFAGETAPEGWVICDGRTLDATSTSVEYDILPNGDAVSKYYWLWGVLGTTYGGTGQSSFKVPDLRGEFIRGYDHGNGNDPRVFGSKQKDLLKAHKHIASNNDCRDYSAINGIGTGTYNGWCDTSGTGSGYGAALTGDGQHPEQVVSGVPTVGSETRPRNIALNYIIKI